MAIVKGILVNDGGAPARIMNFEASEAITAGQPVSLLHVASGDCTVQLGDSDDTTTVFLGVALTDAASGDQCSVVTGRGVMVYMKLGTDVNGAIPLMLSSTPGELVAFADGTSPVNTAPCAVTVEDGGTGLVKCMIL